MEENSKKEKNIRNNEKKVEQKSEFDEGKIEKEKELLRVKKKYSIKYILLRKMLEPYAIYMIAVAVLVNVSMYGSIFLCTLLLLLIMFVMLALSKKSAANTYISFLETKLVYRRKFLFVNKRKVMNYSDIDDIVFTYGPSTFTKIFYKAFHFGNIYVYPKKGTLLTNGISLEVVADIEKVIDEIKNTIGDKIV